MSLYGSGIFYSSGAKYVGATSTAAQGIPIDLRFYRTTQDGIYVFWFGFDPAFISPSLSSAGFDLELDTARPFTVTSVTDSTHLVVSSTSGMASTNTIFQGTNTTTITTVDDGTHLTVASTTGWIVGPASAITFNTPNLASFTQLTAITYQNGNVRKGFAVPVAARIEGIEQTWYARVRTHTPSFISDWSKTLTWTIPQKVQQQYAEALMKSLPDSHVYGKGDLLVPVNQRNSNLYLVDNMYGNQLDKVFYENFLTQTDNYVDLCRDEFLQQNFGVLFNFSKPPSLQFVDYRWILMNLFLASLVGSTNEAIILTVQSFTGVPPAVTNIRDLNDFFLVTIQDDPITQNLFTTTITTVTDGTHLVVGNTVGWIPGVANDTTAVVQFNVVEVEDATHLVVDSTVGMSNGDTIKQSVFNTSQPYIDDTLVVEDITTGLLVPTSAYVTDGARADWTMKTPTTDTLQATFDVGNPNDPFPVVFDSLAGSTLLTGLLTFTNGSRDVVGVGTLFLAELLVGQQITDPNGIYLGTIDEIADNTHLQLLSPWIGTTEATTVYRLLYTDLELPPPILWDKSTLEAGVLITIFNPGGFALI